MPGRRGEVGRAPTEGIEVATTPDGPAAILTDAGITALLTTCAVGRGRPGTSARPRFLGRRNKVIVRLLSGTGVRGLSCARLEPEDVDLDREVDEAALPGPSRRSRGAHDPLCRPRPVIPSGRAGRPGNRSGTILG